jgi:hypothetical protein
VNQPEVLVPVVAIGGFFLAAIVCTIVGCIAGVRSRRHIEDSRRELAAYVAEGTVSVDDAERLLNAGGRPGLRSCSK